MTTFVLRMTTDARGGLHGTISRVSSGETRTFASSAQLVAFLEEWNAETSPSTPVRELDGSEAHRHVSQ
jgi:hypothetical protein